MSGLESSGGTPRPVRTATLLQMEAVECGAASLGIVLAHHGLIEPLSTLRVECGVSRDGSNAANVVRAARRYGMRAKGLSTGLEDVAKLRPPFIVFWNFNHFLVVEGFRKGRVRLNDPAIGRREVSLEEFDEGFTGVVLLMEPGEEFRRGGIRPSVVRALHRRLRGTARDLAFAIGAGALLVAPGLAAPMLIQLLIDEVLIRDRAEWLRPLLFGLAAVGAVHVSLRLLQLRYLRELRTRLAIRLSGGFLWHVLRLPVGFFAQRFAGEISSRVALNEGIADALSGRLATAAIDAMMVLFYLLVMLIYDWQLTLVGLAFAAANLVALRWIAERRTEANLRLRQEQGKVAGITIAGLASIETLKASALEASFFTRWAGYYTKATSAAQELGLSNQALGVLPGVLAALTNAAVLLLGGLRVIDGQLSIGALVAFQGLMLAFQRPFATLVDLGATIQTLAGDLSRVDDVLEHPVDPATATREAADAPVERLAGRVELRQVTFGYSRVSPPLIRGLDLVIEPGQRVALVGGSGSGKSTIAKLVCGLYEPWEGEILFDGRPRASLDRRTLAASLALVDQEIVFFGGTVRDNLTLWDASVPLPWIEEACRDADIRDTVRALPGGYDADLLEGAANLSGGQRQRLEIARALVNRPSVLVLDEATSALDAATEHEIDRGLRRRGCSTLVVAHRLSTIRDAEEIIVLHQGEVVQRGTHEALWAAGGEYARLLQSEGDTV